MTIAIHLVSMRRSGTHMLANWLSTAFNAKIHNNVSLQAMTQHNNKKGRVYKQCEKALFIWEDIPPQQWYDQFDRANFLEHALGKYDKHIVVTNIRDPFNTFASRIKHWNLISSEGTHIRQGEALGPWNDFYNFSFYETLALPTYKINYNKFVDDAEFRTKLYNKFEQDMPEIKLQSLVEADKTLEKHDKNGNGSSFTGMKKRDNYHDGYKFYTDVEAFHRLIQPYREIANDKWGIK